MDKKIEDYLHLYIGKEVQVPYGDTGRLNFVSAIDGFCDVVFGSTGPDFNKVFFLNEVKLILRPLSDMTEEEAREGWRYVKSPHYSGVTNYQYALTHLSLSLNVQQHAEVIKWMLSKGFDLFGLIESNLAISKVEVSNPLKTQDEK